MKEIRFGACLNIVPEFLRAHDWDGLRKIAVECENFGYDSIWVMDHFGWDTGPNILECWTTLAALAASTNKIRLGTLVLCNSYRHPPLLAKMAATLDVISNGRLDLGIGAGWREVEYLAYGYEFPPPAIRVRMLREAVNIIQKLWTEEKTTFSGKYYSIREATLGPRPVQKPHPPLWIGAYQDKMLRMVAEFADGWNVVDHTLEQYAEKTVILRKHCAAVGRSMDSIKKSLLSPVVIGKTLEEARQKQAQIKPPEISGDSFKTRIVGTAEDCIRRIDEYRNLGLTHFIIELESMNANERRVFAEEIMPAFA